MECERVVFSGHAVRRMFERSLTEADILRVIRQGEVIESYPNDTPFPSELLLDTSGAVPIHAVVGREGATGRCVVVTVYMPDPARWSADFKTRRTR